MNANEKVILVNNTGSDIRMFDEVLADCVNNSKPLPEDMADTFSLEIFVRPSGSKYGVLNFL